MQEQIEFKNTQNEILDARIHLPDEPTKKCVVIAHGIHGNKNLIWLYQIAECLAAHGIAACRFDFSGHGDSQGDFGELDFTKGQSDLTSVIEGLKDKGYNQFAVIGHSLGGAISLITVPDHPEIQCLVDVAGPACPYREANEDYLRKMYEDAGIKDGALLTEIHEVEVVDRVKLIEVPTLVIHGTEDEVIPIAEGKRVFELLPVKDKKLEIIEGGDHILLDYAAQVVSCACEWVTKYL